MGCTGTRLDWYNLGYGRGWSPCAGLGRRVLVHGRAGGGGVRVGAAGLAGVFIKKKSLLLTYSFFFIFFFFAGFVNFLCEIHTFFLQVMFF